MTDGVVGYQSLWKVLSSFYALASGCSTLDTIRAAIDDEPLHIGGKADATDSRVMCESEHLFVDAARGTFGIPCDGKLKLENRTLWRRIEAPCGIGLRIE